MIQNMLARIPNPQQAQVNLGNIGSLASATQPSNSGAMGGIMDSVQTGFDQLDSAMQGAFDTIKSSLSSNYTPQEVLVPNEGGGGQQPSFPGGGGGFPGFGMQPQPFRPGGEFVPDPMGETTQVLPDNMGIEKLVNALPSPDIEFDFRDLMSLQGAQPRLPDITGQNFGPSPFGPAGPMENLSFVSELQSLAQGNPTGGIGNAQMGVTNLNQDNNIGGASAQQQIDQMIAGNAGQYNG